MSASSLPLPHPGYHPSLTATADGASPFERLAIAIDFRVASLGAARWVTAHLAPDADVALLHVVPVPEIVTTGGAPRSAMERTARQLTPSLVGGLGGFAATLGAHSTRSLVRFGPPAAVIPAVSRELAADLLVLGRNAPASGSPERDGSLIARVASRTATPLLVVPHGTQVPVTHVLAAVDDGPDAARVLHAADAVARQHGAPLTALHVMAERRIAPVGRGPAWRRRTGAVADRPRAAARHASTVRAREWLAACTAPLRSIVRLDIAIGDPRRLVPKHASQLGATLLVVGAGGVGDAGAVARHVLHHAGCPVLMLAPAATADVRRRSLDIPDPHTLRLLPPAQNPE